MRSVEIPVGSNGVESDEREPNFSDPSDFEDDIDDDELVGDILQSKPNDAEYEECCLIIEGIPQVDEDRLTKLRVVLGKIFKKFNDNYIDEYPRDSDGKTKGYCFVEYPNRSSAVEAAAVLNGYQLDKNHHFCANLFSDLKKFTKPDDNWHAPEPRKYKNVGDLWWWLQNEKCQDQFAIHYERGAMRDPCPLVAVYWIVPGGEPVIVNEHAEKQQWTETIFQWSPKGTYMTTIHQKGVILWGGVKFEQCARFMHEKVMWIDYSPQEKWSADDSYFACLKPGGGGISVYETSTFGLVDKKSIIIDNIKDFKWSPQDPIIAYVVDEEGESQPAVIAVMKFGDRTERTVRVFRMAEATMYWQKSGDLLAVRNDRYSKKKIEENNEIKYSGITSNIEIFHMRLKDIPVESLQLADPFLSFGWEPTGDKFCILTGSQSKATPLIYRALEKGVQLMAKLDPSPGLNRVMWAPAGGWLVLFAARTLNGTIIFIDTNPTEPLKMNSCEHAGANKGYWDPTGRYFATCCTVHGAKAGADFGYRIYSFQGRELVRNNIDRLSQFHWRPKPAIKLPDEKIKEIRKNLKTMSKKFEEDDKRERGRASQEVIAKRRSMMNEFNVWKSKALNRYESEHNERIRLRGGVDTDQLEIGELDEETIEIPLSTEQMFIEKHGEGDE